MDYSLFAVRLRVVMNFLFLPHLPKIGAFPIPKLREYIFFKANGAFKVFSLFGRYSNRIDAKGHLFYPSDWLRLFFSGKGND